MSIDWFGLVLLAIYRYPLLSGAVLLALIGLGFALVWMMLAYEDQLAREQRQARAQFEARLWWQIVHRYSGTRMPDALQRRFEKWFLADPVRMEIFLSHRDAALENFLKEARR